MKMKILVIFTGGTIGSVLNDGWIAPDKQTKRELIRHYEETHGDSVEFVTSEPYSILSENLTANELNVLVKTVYESANKDYDGIIVTHGTDTLQYSAAALDFALGTESLPVILVSSNYPLDDERSNGHINFEASVAFIGGKKGKGVYVAYANEGENVFFHRGGAVLSHREAEDSVFSVDNKVYGEYVNGSVVVNECVAKAKAAGGVFTLCEKSGILVVNPYPGDMYDYDLDKYGAIILRPYHSGTLNTSSKSFEQFCAEAKKKNIPCFVVNIKEGDAYESSKEFERLGIIPVYTSSFISTYVRLWIAISRGEDLKKGFSL